MTYKRYLLGTSAEDRDTKRGQAEGVREQAEDKARTVTSRLAASRMQPSASSWAIAFCQTVGASWTRTLGSSRALPYWSNQTL